MCVRARALELVSKRRAPKNRHHGGVSFTRRRCAHGVYRKCTPRAPPTPAAAGLCVGRVRASSDRFSPSLARRKRYFLFAPRRLVLLLQTKRYPAANLLSSRYIVSSRTSPFAIQNVSSKFRTHTHTHPHPRSLVAFIRLPEHTIAYAIR